MTLGVTMIVKNESEVLCRVLDGVKDVADEIIIADTGSTDDTAEIARRYTDKVFAFEWADDFSAARNFVREKCTADYWLWLDADDIVPRKTALGISRFVKSADGSVNAVMLPYVAATDGAGKPTFSYYRERILKNTPNNVWRGVVHEAVSPSGPTVRLPYPIIHAKPNGRVGGTRNLDIYRAAISRGETLDPRGLYYFARELYYNGFYAEAEQKLREFLGTDGFYINKIDGCLLLSRLRRREGDFDGAVKSVLDGFSYAPPTGEGCCELGGLFFERGDYLAAAYWYECATRIKPDPKSGGFIDHDCYGFTPLVWLTVCHDRLGDRKRAYRCHCRAKKLRPDHPSIIANDRYFASLGYL
ncbi:MAG: glycosyltransferase [Clostridia bacterium]|nr:glycosyltransferase [Clostridia bacterium]